MKFIFEAETQENSAEKDIEKDVLKCTPKRYSVDKEEYEQEGFCPTCGEKVYFTSRFAFEKQVCPNCGQALRFVCYRR